MGSLEWVRERRMPFPQLGYGSDKPFALEKAFVIENVISCDYCVPLSIKTMKGSFLVLNCENLVGFLEYKPMNVWGPLSDHGLYAFLSDKSTLSLQLTWFMALTASTPGKQSSALSLCMTFSLQIFGCWFPLKPQFSERSKKNP